MHGFSFLNTFLVKFRKNFSQINFIHDFLEHIKKGLAVKGQNIENFNFFKKVFKNADIFVRNQTFFTIFYELKN